MYGDHRDLHSFPTRRSSDRAEDARSVTVTDAGADLVAVEPCVALGARAVRCVRRPEADVEWLQHVRVDLGDRKSTRLNSSHANISYAVFCLKKTTNQRVARP